MALIIHIFILVCLISSCPYGCSPEIEPASNPESDNSPSSDIGGSIFTDEAGAESLGDMTIEREEESDMMSGCSPHDDQCSEGQYCQYLEGRLRCIDNGEVEPDPRFHSTPNCPTGVCSRGGICYQVHRSGTLQAPQCFWVCDPVSIGSKGDCPNGRHTCYQAEDAEGQPLPFAICDY